MGFTRLVGWLFTGYVAWLLGFVYNGPITSLLAFVILGALGWKLWRERRSEQLAFVKENAGLIFAYEVAFLTLFLVWSLVRMKHPNIEGQEKFMDFAFFNSILRDAHLPPADPWLAGPRNFINYYYFGYFLNAAFARLTFIGPDFLYNLAVSNNFALCGLGLLSLGYNMTRALWPGVAGLFALEIFGNLHGALQVLRIQWSQPFSWWEPTRLIKDVFANGHYLNRWWWSASDASLAAAGLGADAAKDGLISEFPAFSFLHGDLHPHFTALPLTLLMLALGLNLVKSPERAPLSLARRLDGRALSFGALALTLGAIFMANTWDIPSAGLTLSLLLLAQQNAQGQLAEKRWMQQWLLPSLLLLLGLLLASLPFNLFFHNPARGFFKLHGAHTGLHDTLIFWGVFLSVLFPYAVLRLRSLGQGPAAAAAKPSAARAGQAPKAEKAAERICASCGAKLRPGKAICGACGARYEAPEAPAAEALVLPPPAWAQAWTQLFVAPAKAMKHPSVRFGAPVLAVGWLALAAVWPTVAVFSALAFASALILASRGASREGLFSAALVLVASLLVLLTEFAYLPDAFSGNPSLTRMNTVFKFYFQAWVLLAASLPFALHWTFQRLQRSAFGWRVAYGVLLGALSIAALVYPAKAIAFVWADFDYGARFAPTLDGAAWFARDYPADWAAVKRIRQVVKGQPVIAEAVGGAYSHFARVSAYTGLRAIVGWGNHESQWRDQWPSQAEADCNELYSTLDLVRARQLLDKYGVEYVFIGQLERQKYGATGGLEKFDQLGRPVVDEMGSRLYKINR